VFSVLDGIVEITKKEDIEGINTITKQTLFDTIPPVFILSLKRFVYDVKQNRTRKLLDHIKVEEILHLPSEISTFAVPASYKLAAGIIPFIIVVNHHGSVAQGGHYTCDVNTGEIWQRFDDTSITQVDKQTVLNEQKDRQPYILFYTKND
jgi:ubiquitin C-terminal hydrolase